MITFIGTETSFDDDDELFNATYHLLLLDRLQSASRPALTVHIVRLVRRATVLVLPAILLDMCPAHVHVSAWH